MPGRTQQTGELLMGKKGTTNAELRIKAEDKARSHAACLLGTLLQKRPEARCSLLTIFLLPFRPDKPSYGHKYESKKVARLKLLLVEKDRQSQLLSVSCPVSTES